MGIKSIHINCDLGEGCDQDEALMGLVSQVNIACGGHAGSPALTKKSLLQAQEKNCLLGAHPGYQDKAHFGRRSLNLTRKELLAQLKPQLDLFGTLTEQQGLLWHHIKPHGALYHDLAEQEDHLQVFLELLKDYPVSNLFLKTTERVNTHLRTSKVKLWKEAFLDRGYNAEGDLLPRSEKGGVLKEKEAVERQLKFFLINDPSDTYCIHGDHAESVSLLQYIHTQLPRWGYTLSQ
jgi:UPF0271 protein